MVTTGNEAALRTAPPRQAPAYGEAVHAGHQMPKSKRAHINRVALWMFFFSESFMFGGLLAGKFYLAGAGHDAHLDQFLGLLITSILLLSSVTAYQAETAIKHGKTGQCVAWLFLTIVFGAIFAVGVGFEWATAHFSVHEPFGTAFFAMTGIHAAHVISGVFMLVLIYRLVRRGRFGPDHYWPVEATVKYWHFVDVVWVFFYPALYLTTW